MDFVRRTWAEIDLDALDYNVEHIKSSRANGQKLMGIVKADAYGHGDGFVSRHLAKNGFDWFGVSNVEEAISLRVEGITQPILILGYTPVENVSMLSDNDITQTAISFEFAKQLQEQAAKIGKVINVHIKLDTGMTRLGFQCDLENFENSVQEIVAVNNMPNIYIDGIFTHFAVADSYTDSYPEYTKLQYSRYINMLEACEKRGVKFNNRHCANSAATISYPEKHLDMIRSGVITYGMLPSSECTGKIDIKPLMTLKTTIALVKKVRFGEKLSYGLTYTLERDSIIATVPIGYADGYNRLLSNKARMLVNGQFAPVVGRVCMDQLMLDVTDIKDVKMGDEVVVFGRQGENEIPVEELAEIIGTINYEMTCVVTKRVPRVYKEKGEVVGVLNHVMHQYR